MKWEGNRESDNVEDRRSSGGGGGFGGGRSIGIGTVVLALIGWGVFGINPLTTIGVLSGADAPQVQQAPAQRPPGDDRQAAFVSTVLASTEDVWGQIFQQGGAQYREPKLVRRAHAHGLWHRPAPWGRFTARATRRSTWTWTSSTP
jgi:predicted metalloprotease